MYKYAPECTISIYKNKKMGEAVDPLNLSRLHRLAAFSLSTDLIIIIIMTFIPRILASASNAPKQSHCQTGKSLAVYKKPQKSQ